jgi:hypothetical protein
MKELFRLITLSSFGAAFVEPFLVGDDATQIKANTKLSENSATVVFSESNFTIPAQGFKNVTVTFTAPKSDALLPIFSGYLVISNDIEEIPVHVPYAGVIGDWSEAPIFTRISPTLGSTGLFNSALQPIQGYVNGTLGVNVLAIGATTSRSFKLNLEYTGTNFDAFTALNLDVKMLPAPYFANVKGTLGGRFARNFASLAVNKYIWKGEVDQAVNSTQIKLPAGDYIFKFYGLKHFRGEIDTSDPTAFDIVEEKFTLVY